MKRLNPGGWSEELIKVLGTGRDGVQQDLGDCDEETAAKVTEAAQEWAARFTVVIGGTGVAQNSMNVRDLRPGSGVVVQLNGNTFGVLTAGHVLRRDENSSDNAGVSLLTAPRHRESGTRAMGIDLSPRPCTVIGFSNETEEGPDIAIIPLEKGEMDILDTLGVNAYNLEKERWSDEDKARLGEMKPWLLSIINGVRCEASQIVEGHTDGSRGSLAVVATNTQVEVARESDGHDYLELPSETTEQSYPTYWREPLPGTAAREIEELDGEGVTRLAWGGISGAGVWNVAISAGQNGLPDERNVFGELAGICYYAEPDKGCIIAHGQKSIAKISMSHMEREALRYHNNM